MPDEPNTLEARNQRVAASGPIRLLANARGVDLTTVQGTGAGGRISRADVLARSAAAGASRPSGTGADPARRTVGRFGPPSAAAVSSLAKSTPGLLSRARAKAPEPTLFGSGGDLPPFTASGIPPESLLQVPWQARHALAGARSTADAYAILDDFTGLSPEDAEAVAVMAYGGHDGNVDYAYRVEDWLAAAMGGANTTYGVPGENQGWGHA